MTTFYYWCEECNSRWTNDKEDKFCPRCKSLDFRKTVSPEEARERGLK